MFKRPVVGCAIAYIAGLLLGTSAIYYPVTTLGLGTLGVVGWIRRRRPVGVPRWPHVLTAGLLLFGAVRMWAGGMYSDEDSLMPFQSSERVWTRGRIVSPPGHRPGRIEGDPDSTRVLLDDVEIRKGGPRFPANGRIRLAIHGFEPNVAYGDIVEVFTVPRPIGGFRNPGGFDYGRYMERRDVRARAAVSRPEDLRILGNDGHPILGKVYEWREEIRIAMARSLSPQGAAVLQAMIIGEDAFISPEIRDAFMISGTVHILSISGSHLGLLAVVFFGSVTALIRRLPEAFLMHAGRRLPPRRLAACLTWFPVIFYTLLSGSQIATVRSLVMILVYLGAVGLARDHDPLHSLSLAALLVMLVDPRTLFDIAFQLSYVAILVIVLAVRGGHADRRTSRPVVTGAARILARAQKLFLITVAASLGTAPFVAHYFNQWSWAGLLANPVITPLVGGFIVPAGLISAVWVIVTGSSVIPLAELQDGAIRILVEVAVFFSNLPGAAVHVASPPVAVAALWYAGAGSMFLSKIQLRWRFVAAMVFLAFTLPWILGVGQIAKQNLLRVTFLDVGQGDAAVVQFPSGQTMVIDGGARYGDFDVGRFVVAPYLWDLGVASIDHVVISHPQADHAGGLGHILTNFRVKEVWTNGIEKEADFFNRLMNTVDEKKIRVRAVHRETPEVRFGDTTVRILNPPAEHGNLGSNDQSLVLQIFHGRRSVLFTGDVETAAEREMVRWGEPARASVLKVPHHGSRSSIDPKFLLRVAPDLAVVSSGIGNPYGHPAPETLEAYRLLGAQVHRTDRAGSVIVETNGSSITVFTFSDFRVSAVEWGRDQLREEWENWKKTVDVWLAFSPA